MAGIDILDLVEATEVNETTDYLAIVDKSDTSQDVTGSTKRATVRKLLGDKALPSGDFVGTTDTQTLTNKTLTSPEINTPTGDVVTPTGTQTLTNKTLTSPVINTQVSGTAVLDEDNMSSNSDNKLATQQSIKAYVDSGKAGASYMGFLTAESSTTSSAQVGSCQVTVTTKGGNLLIIGFAPLKTSGASSFLGLELDGSDISGVTGITNLTTYMIINVVYVKTSLSAGSHTIKLKYLPQPGYTAYIASYIGHGLIVAEL